MTATSDPSSSLLAAPPADTGPPLRIAFLSYRGKPHCGGQGVYTKQLTKALQDLGHHVEVFGGQPYPELDERVELHKLPSLDTFNDHYPGRLPGYWEVKDRHDLLEMAQFLTGTFPSHLPSQHAPHTISKTEPVSSTWCTTTSVSATAS